MRRFLLVCALSIAMIPAALADEGEGVPLEEPVQVESRLDQLFSELKRARHEGAAERIASRIVREWANSGSATVDLMMQWASDAADERKFDVALDFLDQVIALEPGFAEGWNQRAAVHFAMRDHRKSMSDIQRALHLEPRHFGALGGMARILERSGRNERALQAYERLLDVYPMLRSAQEEVGRLADELAGRRI